MMLVKIPPHPCDIGLAARGIQSQRSDLGMNNEKREARERLAVFLPASLVRRLRQSVPPGARSDFAACALEKALEEGCGLSAPDKR